MSAPRNSTPIISRLRSSLRRLPHTRPWLGGGLRLLAWVLGVGYFGFALLLLALRYAILPNIESYRGEVEQMIGAAMNRPVGIRKIEAHWAGLQPALKLAGLEIRDAQGRPALGFDQVDAELAWSSLWHFQLRLARLELNAPTLMLRRDGTGRFFAAGLEITPQADDKDDFADWLLAQDRILVRDASVTWQDELRGAPPLELKHLNFQLDNSGSRHRFGFTAEPPPHLAARIDIRGDFKGRDLDLLDAWKGEAYAELDYADLAGWRAWVDYPVSLPQGSGALRLWLGFANQQLVSATADVRLADLRLQLRPDLPELDLLLLEGRLAGRRLDSGFEAELKHLTLTARDGLTLQPTDLTLSWQGPAADRPARGKASANGLDLAALAHLAGHLPLDEAIRQRLARHAPRGRVADLKLDWKARLDTPGRPAIPETWSVKSRFEGLGLSALGPIPGVAGLNGRIAGDEKGGDLKLDGQRTTFELPTLFAEAKLELDAFSAELDWKSAADGLQVGLRKAAFNNKDAAGEASGKWRALPSGPGALELDARLTRGSGDAVWRYMPLAVGRDVRDWLRGAIVGGKAGETTLKLRGDLRQFPFRGGKDGIFEVRGKFHDATLRYAGSWPEINAIDGELLFEGVRMLITGKSGKIFGVGLREVRAEIADIEQAEELLTVSGKASGPTTDFLRFIEASPVGGSIDHFTEDMKAEGSGELDLKLSLPLRHLANSKVDGSYRFDGNRLIVDGDLPPLADVRGALRFSASHLEARGLRGTLLGSPLSVDLKTAGDGAVQVNAAGEVAVATLRQQFPHPVFDHLSGSTKWTGNVRAKKKSAEVKLTSNLIGVSSSLPEPFNKSAAETLAFSFERKAPPDVAARTETKVPEGMHRTGLGATATKRQASQDMFDVRLGDALRLQLVRRHDTGPALITRGLVAIGNAGASLPERDLLVAVNLPRINADAWRELLAKPGNGGENAALPLLPTVQFDLRSADLSLQGKSFHEVRVSGSRAAGAAATRFDLKSRELAGSFEWDSSGSGKLSGRIAQLALPESVASPATLQAKTSEVIDQIPALDITVDQLSFKDRVLGTVRLAAENREGYWNTKLDVKNDDGSLQATGRWRRSQSQPDTRIEFKLGAKNIDKLLARIGHPDTVRRGSANLSGNLSWSGSPFTLDYPSLNGSFNLDAAGGQFVKLEPGVGRLLGILSLQSLPRRITLDFRDIFSEGFAFDSIGGQFVVARGILETKELQIQGPSAKVLMSGSINLGAETQNLKVRVQPAVGESLAVGAMLAHPLAGAVVWAAQKILKDPLDQAFAFEYAITGSWADPKVDKLGQVKPHGMESGK